MSGAANSSSPPKKRGGARPGAGRKKKDVAPIAPLDGRSNQGRALAQGVLDEARSKQLWLSLIAIERERLGLDELGRIIPVKKDKDGNVIDGPDYQGKFSVIPLVNLLRYLEARAYGNPMDTVNHLHDKPIELNATLTLGEGMRVAMAKAEERLKLRK